MWPKVIFLYPSAIVALICWAGMMIISDRTEVPFELDKVDRWWTPQNLLGVFFLAVLAFNLIVMALDFPRFSFVAVILGVCFLLFFVLWLGAYFHLDLLKPLHAIFAHIYAVANRGFYLMFFVTLMIVFLVIWATRWLDYWEIMPNEILHHHGPLSDLERYPTMNLKFDKEIPDVLEYAMLGAGPAGPTCSQRHEGDCAGQRPVHQWQGEGSQADDESPRSPRHDRQRGR